MFRRACVLAIAATADALPLRAACPAAASAVISRPAPTRQLAGPPTADRAAFVPAPPPPPPRPSIGLLALLMALDRNDASAVATALRDVNMSELTPVDHVRLLQTFVFADNMPAMAAHFDAMELPSAAAYSIVIKAFLRRHRLNRAATYLERMVADPRLGEQALEVTLVAAVLVAVSKDVPNEAAAGQRILQLLRTYGQRPDAGLLNNQVQQYDSLQHMGRYFQLLQSIGVAPDRRALNMLIESAAKVGDVSSARLYLATCTDCGIRPDVVAYNGLLHALMHQAQHEECFVTYKRMRREKIEANFATYIVLFRAAVALQRPVRIRNLFKRYLAMMPSTQAGQTGWSDVAEPPALPAEGQAQPPAALFNAALQSLMACRDYKGVLRVLNEMQARAVDPNVRTALSLVGDPELPKLRPDLVGQADAIAARFEAAKPADSDPPEKRRARAQAELAELTRFVSALGRVRRRTAPSDFANPRLAHSRRGSRGRFDGPVANASKAARRSTNTL
eukprot:TRINITY_DN9328_c0_g1_i3.p1 TRINITY_DN9328_c0_g1~~TRINITY_DN9328_c0_g1_i3.p1  ORF type:complete len:507 (-),score=143.06 TRINITY_DN9328_c0_g1_i3:39-1559(-)